MSRLCIILFCFLLTGLLASARDKDCFAWLAESKLPGAGRGVFAGVPLNSGDVLAINRPAQASDAVILGSQLSTYGFGVESEGKQSTQVLLGPASFINAATEQFANVYHTERVIHDKNDKEIGRFQCIIAARRIEAGEEVFLPLEKTQLTSFGIDFVDIGDHINTKRRLSDFLSSGAMCLTDVVPQGDEDGPSEKVIANRELQKGDSFTIPAAIVSDELFDNYDLIPEDELPDQMDFLSRCCFGPHKSSSVMAIPLGIPGRLVHSTRPNLAFELENGAALSDNLWKTAGSPFVRAVMRFVALRPISTGSILTVDRKSAVRKNNTFWPAQWKTDLMVARLDAAVSGDVRAQFEHAQSLWLGAPASGRVADKGDAVKWLRKASEGGHVWANQQLAEAYTHGLGVNQDMTAATQWYEKAAKGGVCEACLALGEKFYNGWGVEQNISNGVYWLHRGASQNCAAVLTNSNALHILALAYEKGGAGVPQNSTEAVRWYREAADLGDASAQAQLGMMYSGGLGVEEDKDAAVDLYKKSAQQGNLHGQLALGLAYAHGTGPLKVDPRKAFSWIQKAAKQGSDVAQLTLGEFYKKGFGVTANNKKARSWFQKAADKGNEQAKKSLISVAEWDTASPIETDL